MNPTTAPGLSFGPGLLGFIVVAAIGFALFFLIKSMNKQMTKIEVPHEREQPAIPVREA
ncbi:hypothetical protein [Microtetraspora sp. NBRC 16547]|uniref:hypothetical protein n=1 Tax=Microtetraspora sp. NBRC 16547 TaxID=3030993 RepID=UPI0024A268BB|nr:hypothetical protein [Microtetraspora sp. NBRC 16547]GLW97626.1 hypothetical protein Misp02_17130 [Microtetraspora sp. NBRC 16547]